MGRISINIFHIGDFGLAKGLKVVRGNPLCRSGNPLCRTKGDSGGAANVGANVGENVAESDKDALIFVERRWLFRGRGKGRELLVLELEVRHFTWSESIQVEV